MNQVFQTTDFTSAAEFYLKGSTARTNWLALCLSCCLTCLALVASSQDDWPIWRGPTKDGIAPAGQRPPTEWGANRNVLWKTAIPGKGHSSPVIVGNQIFLTTSEAANQTQSVLSIDRKTGKQLWQTTIYQGELSSKIHPNNTHASSTVAATSERVFATFWNNDRVVLVALDHDGKQLWKKTAGPFVPRYPFGYGASPCLYKNMVIVNSECEKLGTLTAFRQSDGSEVWRTPRNVGTGYSSPIVHRVAGRDQLLISGSNSVTSYDPRNGQEIWSVAGPWEVTCGTMVFSKESYAVAWPFPYTRIDIDMVFASGGYPRGSTVAIPVTDEPSIRWRNPVKSYEQSMLSHQGYLYAVSDNGVGYCWNALTGKEMWKQRLAGPISASPVLAGDNIYVTTERGKTFVFKADPLKFDRVAENQLGDSCFASLTIVQDRIYMRVGMQPDGDTQQWLYCLTP